MIMKDSGRIALRILHDHGNRHQFRHVRAVLLRAVVPTPLTLWAMTLTIQSDEIPAPAAPEPEKPAAPEPEKPAPTGRRRLIAMSIWAVGFTAWWFLLGLPMTDPILLFLW